MMAAQSSSRGGVAPESRELGGQVNMEVEQICRDSHAISSDFEDGEVHSDSEVLSAINLQGTVSSIAEVEGVAMRNVRG